MKLEIDSLTFENPLDIKKIISKRKANDYIRLEIHGLSFFSPPFEPSLLVTIRVRLASLQTMYSGPSRQLEQIFVDLSENDQNSFVFSENQYASLEMKLKIAQNEWQIISIPASLQTFDPRIGHTSVRSEFEKNEKTLRNRASRGFKNSVLFSVKPQLDQREPTVNLNQRENEKSHF
jgi:hypothetical protein